MPEPWNAREWLHAIRGLILTIICLIALFNHNWIVALLVAILVVLLDASTTLATILRVLKDV